MLSWEKHDRSLRLDCIRRTENSDEDARAQMA